MADIKQGQMVSIKRGRLAGQAGEVIEVTKDEVALKLNDDALTVQKVTNIKVPDAAVITEDALAEIIQNEVKSAPDGGVFLPLIDRLEDALPGFAARITV